MQHKREVKMYTVEIRNHRNCLELDTVGGEKVFKSRDNEDSHNGQYNEVKFKSGPSMKREGL